MKPLVLVALVLSLPAGAQPADSLAARLDRVVDAAHAAGAFDGVRRVGRGDWVVSAELVRAALQSE